MLQYGMYALVREGRSVDHSFLSSTVLQVEISPETVFEGDEVILTCMTSCNRTDTPTYIWYKNGLLVPSNYSNNLLHLPSVSQEDVGNYRCAAQFSLRNYCSPEVSLQVQSKGESESESRFIHW